MSIFKRHLRSIKVKHEKNTEKCATKVMPAPASVRISMAQHIGAPCTPLVKKGDYVKVGQPIGEAEAFVSAPIHSSVSGTVTAVEFIRSVTGGRDQVVVIETDGNQEVWEDVKPPVANNKDEFIEAIKNSGLVGLGGAAFPTHVKFNPQNLDEVDTLIVNAAECEPFITSDHRLMLEEPQDIIDGCVLTMKYLGLKECYIGIESNKPDAIAVLEKLIKDQNHPEIKVITLRSRYPQGAERVMVYEITGKTLNAGALPASLGIILSNVNTIAFVGKYFRTGMPLVSKRITVDGTAVTNPGNVMVPIGTAICDVVEFCGGYKAAPEKIIMGGPMMGRTVYSDRFPIIKNNNAILVQDAVEAWCPGETACIKCGKCYTACPFNLLPIEIKAAFENRDVEKLQQLQVNQCMECGSCTYVCPARRPLSFVNKKAKLFLKEEASR